MFGIKPNTHPGFFMYLVIGGRFFYLGNRESALAAAREDGENV